LSLKDPSELARRAARAGLGARELDALGLLPELHGSGDQVFPRAERALAGTRAADALAELKRLWQAVESLGLCPELHIDLGETRAFAYYTGMIFQVLAEGPGEAVGAGGRYDGLLARFGLPLPAAGFAIDLDNLGWALRGNSRPERQPSRLLVSARGAEDALLDALRREGVRCAPAPAGELAAYAKSWRFTHLLEVNGEGAVLTSVASGEREELPRREILVRLVAVMLDDQHLDKAGAQP
jgi:ATP phosphoribosyltransferase regulatory subunit